jgi:23S rRNA (guanosine2251-2'-O)-methyltransferase
MKTKSHIEYSYIFGVHPIIEAIKAKRRPLHVIYTTRPTPKAWGSIERILPPRTQIQYVTREALNTLAGTVDHQGVVAAVSPFPFRKKAFDPAKSKFLLLLDGIQDPRNLGAILRSAFCTNVDGVIICKKQGAPLNGVAIKSSAGLAEHMEIYEAPSATAAVNELKQGGYALYMAALGGVDARTVTYKEPLCLVIGSEGTGISPEVLKQGQKVMLPQKMPDISYNASVAAGILLFSIASASKRI